MNREEAVKAVKKLAASYPGWKPDRETAEIWAEEFMDTDDERVAYNIKDWLRRGEKFMPSLSEMIAPHPHLEARKEKERTQKMLAEKEERRKEAVPAPWIQQGITWRQWFENLPKVSDRD